MFFVIIFYCL